MDYDKRRKEINELVAETRRELVKNALKLQELQESNNQLQEMLKVDSEDDKEYSFFRRFDSLGEALKFIEDRKDNLPKITDKLILKTSLDRTTLKFYYKTNIGGENEDD